MARWIERAFYAGPAIAYAGLLFWLSHQPVLPAPPGNDKLIHVAAYTPLGFLVGRWISGPARRTSLAVVFAAWLATSAYGVLDEVHQSYVLGRHASVGDVVADAVGAAIGAVVMVGLWWGLRRIQRRLP